MSLLGGISAFAVFLGIAAIGFLFLMMSFFLGEIFEHVDLGGHDADAHGDMHGVSFFSTRVLSVFVTAFGGFGAIGIHLGYRIELATILGLAGGFFFGGIIYFFARFLYSQQASSDVRVAELVGRMAEVSVAIPKGGVGQVRCGLGETMIEKIAKSRDGEEISIHTPVTIEAIIGETVLVRPVRGTEL